MDALGLQAIDGWIAREVGGKRALVRLARAQISYWAGRYHPLEAVNWDRVRRLIFLCKGNLCRSPYAAARARALGLPASSYGLRATDGARADARIREAAVRRGLELSRHRARSTAHLALRPTDLVLVMEPSQLEAGSHLCRAADAQLSLLGLWSQPPAPHLEDPFGLSLDYVLRCYERIDRAVAGLARQLARVGRAR